MKTFQRDNRGGGWQKGSGFGEKKTMYRATCSQCGKSCEVPFKPNGSKPVFCSDCFVRDERPSSNQFSGSRDNDRPRFGGRDSGNIRFDSRENDRFAQKQLFRSKCAKCGNSCEVPFKPTGEKPVYCQECFGHGGDARVKHAGVSHGSNSGLNLSQVMDQFKILNGKLDGLMKMLKEQKEGVSDQGLVNEEQLAKEKSQDKPDKMKKKKVSVKKTTGKKMK